MKIKLFFKRFKILFGMFVIIILFIISYLIYINRGNEVIAYDSNEEIIKEKVEEIEEKKEEVKKIKVDIKGMIAIPGVYELDEGSRVIDAINLSGGLLESADTRNINLSKILKDQNVIIISSIKEEVREPEKVIEYVYIECECPKFNDACITNEVVNYQENNLKEENIQNNIETNNEEVNNIEQKNGQVSINNASLEELQTLPGIGEAKAKAIINYRQNNPFTSIEDIMNVSGIGESLFEKIKDSIIL